MISPVDANMTVPVGMSVHLVLKTASTSGYGFNIDEVNASGVVSLTPIPVSTLTDTASMGQMPVGQSYAQHYRLNILKPGEVALFSRRPWEKDEGEKINCLNIRAI